ncbi:hypothetical protein CRE_23217 [Caenorhabditis remanei]|uniref:CUT domain-containing protein n=1 Tax=Caenorhabditis remanei TaxID=31234 RepID=E3NNF0_CAERE|nr:hypothetical protein CRE_23217 [Caenorhabditis remanei]
MIPINNQQTADNSNNPQSELTNVKNQKKRDGSGILKRNKVENQDQDEIITTVKKIKKEDFGVENSTSVGMSGGRKWMLRTELQSRGIPKSSVLSPNYLSSTLFPLLPTTNYHSSPLSVALALEYLSTPISDENYMNAEGIVREIREWLSLSRCSQELFLSHILDVDKRRFDYVIAYPQEYFSLASGRKLFVRMYNWLKMSGYLKMKILSLDLSENKNASSIKVPENRENASPQPETSSDSGDVPLTPDLSSNTSIASDMVTKIINRPVSFVDTKNVSIEVKR